MDTLSPKERSERMGLVHSKDTKPEWIVRRLVHGLGFRYRLHVRSLPGNPDLVFAKRGKIIFVHGCFWHRHGTCKFTRWPKSRMDFWQPKLEANYERDQTNLKALRKLGWKVMVVWECELHNTAQLAKRITRFLGDDQ